MSKPPRHFVLVLGRIAHVSIGNHGWTLCGRKIGDHPVVSDLTAAEDMGLYHELRQTIRTAGGFSSETHWWQGPCICSACSHAWQGVVEIPVEATSPQVSLECSECHQMTGGPA